MREGVHACDKVQARRKHSGPRTLYMPQVRVRTTTALDIACSLRAKRRAAKAARREAPLYIHTYIHVYRRMFMDFFLVFTVCSPAIMVPNAHSGGHPKCIPLYKYKNIVLYIFRAKRVSNCYMQRKKKLTVCVCVCPDVRLMLVLV